MGWEATWPTRVTQTRPDHPNRSQCPRRRPTLCHRPALPWPALSPSPAALPYVTPVEVAKVPCAVARHEAALSRRPALVVSSSLRPPPPGEFLSLFFTCNRPSRRPNHD
jgi:hypothetical protein